MHADVGERPGRPAGRGVHPPVVVGRPRRASPAGRSRAAAAPGRPCRRPPGPGPRGPSGRSGRRTAPWRSPRPRRPGRPAPRPRPGSPPVASRRPRACRPRPPRRTSGAWVAFGVQTCTTSTSESSSCSRVSAADSAPSSSAAARDRCGVEPTTADRIPPLRRMARACTVAMKPPPTMPARMRSVTVVPSLVGGVLGRDGGPVPVVVCCAVGGGAGAQPVAACSARKRWRCARRSAWRRGCGHRGGEEQPLGVRVRRRRGHRRRVAVLDDLAPVHHRDAVADVPDHGEVVADEQVGHAGLLLDLDEQVQHARLGGQVERAHRLVADDELRVAGQRPGDRDPLALAAGELPREPLAGVGRQVHRRRAGRAPGGPRRRASCRSRAGAR